MSHEPKFYSLPDHLQRIYDSSEFSAALKEANRSLDQFRHDVELALKDLTKTVRDRELHEFERTLGPQVLHAALEKFKSDVATELKAVVAKARASELKHHEDALTAQVLKRKSAYAVQDRHQCGAVRVVCLRLRPS